jgi:hypothetical protein
MERAALLGISLTMSVYIPPQDSYAMALRNAGIHYLDMEPMAQILRHVPPSCATSSAPCPIAPQEQAAMLAEVRHHLQQVRNDPLVVGFYVLDDYPGNIRSVLEQVHKLVVDADADANTVRPVVCPFGAPLDYKDQSAGWTYARGDLNQALINYSPRACDSVLLYAYGRGRTTDVVDWDMTRLLPDAKAALASRGWNEQQSPLIGTPQAFARPTGGPTGDQLRRQVSAFCAGGAVAIAPFSWSDGSYDGPKDNLGNDPDLQRGFAVGLATCRTAWGS